VSVSVEPRSPDGKGGWYRTRPTVTIALNDTDGAATALWAWDEAEPAPYFGPLRVPEGVHTLRFFGRDTRGNIGNESRKTFRVDSTAPATKVSISPLDLGGEWYREVPRITFTTDANAQVWHSWDGDILQAYTGPFEAPEGEHTLGFQSRDAAGNSEKQRTLEFRLDTAAPSARLELSTTALLAGDTLMLDAGGSSDQNGVAGYSIDFGDGARKSGPEKRWDHIYETPGVFTVTLKVQDQSGAWSEPVQANVTVSLPPRPPAPAKQASGLPAPTIILGAVAVLVIIVAGAARAARRRRRAG
jgi:hypothetical protein